MSVENIIEEFNNCKGTQFDPTLTDAFLDILKNNFDSIKKIQENFK